MYTSIEYILVYNTPIRPSFIPLYAHIICMRRTLTQSQTDIKYTHHRYTSKRTLFGFYVCGR